MQKYFVFDTEGTGLNQDSTDEVIQLSGFLLDNNFNVVQIIDLYCSTTSPISVESSKVHHITDEILAEKSGGLFLEDYLQLEEYSWLTEPQNITFIAYNSSFDTKLINTTLNENGYLPISFGIRKSKLPRPKVKGTFSVDLMPLCSSIFGYHHNHKLHEVITKEVLCANGITQKTLALSGITQENYLQNKFINFCASKGFDARQAHFHSALFDSFCLLLLLALYKKRMF